MTLLQPPKLDLDGDDDSYLHPPTAPSALRSSTVPDTPDEHPTTTSIVFPSSPDTPSPITIAEVNPAEIGVSQSTVDMPVDPASSLPDAEPRKAPRQTVQSMIAASPQAQGSSSMQSTPTKKTSTFRRLPAKTARGIQGVTHLRTVSVPSPPRVPEKDVRLTSPTGLDTPSPVPSPIRALSPSPVVSPRPAAPIPLPASKLTESTSSSNHASAPSTPPKKPPPIQKINSISSTADLEPVVNTRPTAIRKSAPYPAGFQPRGVYRPLTDDFLDIRKSKRDGEGEGGMTRVERTKLERRLEKLIALHFPIPGEESKAKEGHQEKARPAIRPLSNENRRASSLFDFQSFRNMNINDASDLWRGVVTGTFVDSAKNDIRGSSCFADRLLQSL